jgi:hypothetical protein
VTQLSTEAQRAFHDVAHSSSIIKAFQDKFNPAYYNVSAVHSCCRDFELLLHDPGRGSRRSWLTLTSQPVTRKVDVIDGMNEVYISAPVAKGTSDEVNGAGLLNSLVS